jgi:hypothetical protein
MPGIAAIPEAESSSGATEKRNPYMSHPGWDKSRRRKLANQNI